MGSEAGIIGFPEVIKVAVPPNLGTGKVERKENNDFHLEQIDFSGQQDIHVVQLSS